MSPPLLNHLLSQNNLILRQKDIINIRFVIMISITSIFFKYFPRRNYFLRNSSVNSDLYHRFERYVIKEGR